MVSNKSNGLYHKKNESIRESAISIFLFFSARLAFFLTNRDISNISTLDVRFDHMISYSLSHFNWSIVCSGSIQSLVNISNLHNLSLNSNEFSRSISTSSRWIFIATRLNPKHGTWEPPLSRKDGSTKTLGYLLIKTASIRKSKLSAMPRKTVNGNITLFRRINNWNKDSSSLKIPLTNNNRIHCSIFHPF